MEARKSELACKLTSPEFRQRKATVIAGLKKQLISKKELVVGYSYKFNGADSVIDELISFVKTERLCCDFFDFEVKIVEDPSFAWLTITDPRGPKILSTQNLDFKIKLVTSSHFRSSFRHTSGINASAVILTELAIKTLVLRIRSPEVWPFYLAGLTESQGSA